MALINYTAKQIEDAVTQINSLSLKDYIVEQGTFETLANNTTAVTWHYEKWQSGKAECWCQFEMGSIFGGDMQLWGSLYSTQTPQGIIPFPTNLFVSAPYETATINWCNPVSCWLCNSTGGNETGVTKDHTAAWYIVAPAYYPQGLKVYVTVRDIGYWK